MTTSPTALWVAARRRSRVQRVEPKTGEVRKTIHFSQSRSEDIVYRGGALWAANPNEDTVYKISTSTGDAIPISVGQRPRQLALGDGVVYVTNYNSSDLYAIDEKRSRVKGAPLSLSVNPFSLAVDGKNTVWVGEPARAPADQGRYRSRRVITPVRSA